MKSTRRLETSSGGKMGGDSCCLTATVRGEREICSSCEIMKKPKKRDYSDDVLASGRRIRKNLKGYTGAS